MHAEKVPRRSMDLKGHSWALMLVPAVALIAIFFIFPLSQLIYLAFMKYHPYRIYVSEYTISNFVKFFGELQFLKMLWTSIEVGFCTTVVVLVFGYPIAYYLTQARGIERTVLTAGFLMSMFVTILVTTLGWSIILLPFGLIQQALQGLGLIKGRLQFMHSLPALVVVLAHIHLPYAILILVASIQSVPEEKLQAARMLGAPTWKVYSKIMIPLTMPGIVSSAILIFMLSISSYLIPVLITGQSIRVLPIAIWSYTSELLNWPFAATIAIVLFILTITMTYLFIAITNWATNRGKWEMI